MIAKTLPKITEKKLQPFGVYVGIIRFIFPLCIALLSRSIVAVVDVALAGVIGPREQTFVGEINFFIITALSLPFAMGVVVQSQCALFFGNKKGEKANSFLISTLIFSGIVSFFIITMIYAVREPLLDLMLSKNANNDALSYLTITSLSIFLTGQNYSFGGYWNSYGNTKIYMTSIVLINLLNVFFSCILMFGFLGLPKMGMDGLAWGTVIAILIGNLYYIYESRSILFSGVHYRSIFRYFFSHIKIILKNSISISFFQFFFTIGFVVFLSIISYHSLEQSASFTIILNIMTFIFMICHGIGMGARTCVNRSLGSGDSAKAIQYGDAILLITFTFLFAISLITSVFNETILVLCSSYNREVVDISSTYLRIVSIFFGIDGVAVVLQSILVGVRKAGFVLILHTLLQFGFFIPCAWLSTFVFHHDPILLIVYLVIYRSLYSGILFVTWKKHKWVKDVVVVNQHT